MRGETTSTIAKRKALLGNSGAARIMDYFFGLQAPFGPGFLPGVGS
jgi:hypothetical protein